MQAIAGRPPGDKQCCRAPRSTDGASEMLWHVFLTIRRLDSQHGGAAICRASNMLPIEIRNYGPFGLRLFYDAHRNMKR